MPDGSGYKKNISKPSSPPSGSSGQSGSTGSGGGSGSGAPSSGAGNKSTGGGGGSGQSSPPPSGAGNKSTGGGGGSGQSGAPPTPPSPVPTPYPNSAAGSTSGLAGKKADAASDKAAGARKSPENLQGTGPVGQGDYEVGPGECMSSIALDKGYYWRTIWDHPPNSELKSVRKDPNVLLPKDKVTLPKKNEKQESGATEMRHRFVRRGEPSRFRFQAKVEDEPLRNSDYVLTVDGKAQDGVTDPEGWIDVDLPGNAHSGVLVITCEGQEYRFALNLGHMEPITELAGVQKRLANLGFPPGPIDGKMGPRTRSALAQFQKSQSMEPTGELDEGTRKKLETAHGC